MKVNLQFNILNLVLSLLLGGFLLSSTAYSSEEHDEAGLNKVLNDYHKDTENYLNDVQKLADDIGITETDLTIEEVESVGEYKMGSVPKNRFSNDYANALKKLSNNSPLTYDEKIILGFVPLQNLSDANFDLLLKKALEKNKVELLEKYIPSFIDLTKRIVRSDETLPALLSMIKDRDRLIYFSAAMIISFLFSIFTKRFFYSKKSTFFGVIFGFILHVIFMFCVRMGIIVYFFKEELTPFYKIIVEWAGWRF